MFAFVWPLWKVFSKNPTVGWLIAVVLYGIGVIGNKVLPNIFCVWTSCQYVIFFYIGIRLRLKEERREKLITSSVPWSIWLIADIALFIIFMTIEGRKGLIITLIRLGVSFLLHLVGAISAFVSLQRAATYINWSTNKAFKKISVYSMPMYLFHQQIIYVTIYWLNGKVNPYINAGVNFIAAAAGSFLISAVLMHWKTTRQLIGEK